jgi:hypothetical protein
MNATNASGGEEPAWTPARFCPRRHLFALISEAFRERAAEELRAAVRSVVAFVVTGRGDVQNMMHIVVPLRGVQQRLAYSTPE